MRYYCARSSDDYRDFFYHTIGLVQANCSDNSIRWQEETPHPAAGKGKAPASSYAITFGHTDTIQCGLGRFSIDQDMMIEFNYDARFLHFGILREGLAYALEDGALSPAYIPSSYLALEHARGGVCCWKAGQKFSGSEISIHMDYLTEHMLPALGMPADALSFLQENVRYRPLSPEMVLLLEKLQNHLERDTLTFALLYSIVSEALAYICRDKDSFSISDVGMMRDIQVGSRKIRLSPHDMDKITTARHLLEEEPGMFHTIPDLSRRLNISEQKLKAGFVALYGQTIWSFASSIRMNQAVRLLKSTALSIQDISSSIGYQSVAAFTHTFKKWSGVTPGRFRRMLQSPASRSADQPAGSSAHD